MKATNNRATVYLPKSLYLEVVRKGRQKRLSFSAVICEALEAYIYHPAKFDLENRIRAGFGLWKGRNIDSIKYVSNLRDGWIKRERRFRFPRITLKSSNRINSY